MRGNSNENQQKNDLCNGNVWSDTFTRGMRQRQLGK